MKHAVESRFKDMPFFLTEIDTECKNQFTHCVYQDTSRKQPILIRIIGGGINEKTTTKDIGRHRETTRHFRRLGISRVAFSPRVQPARHDPPSPPPTVKEQANRHGYSPHHPMPWLGPQSQLQPQGIGQGREGVVLLVLPTGVESRKRVGNGGGRGITRVANADISLTIIT